MVALGGTFRPYVRAPAAPDRVSASLGRVCRHGRAGPLDLTWTLEIGKLRGLPARGLLPTAALPGIPSWTWRAMNLDT
jgi:hypothetical protein